MRDSPTDLAVDQAAVDSMSKGSSLCAAAALVIGVVLLAGWFTGSHNLTSFLPGHVAAKPNAALAIVLSAVALFLTRSRRVPVMRLGHTLFVLVGLLSAATILEYLTGWDFGIDQRLFVEPPGAVETGRPGRMACMTAIELLLLATTSILCRPQMCRGRCRAQWIATLGLAVAVIALLGYTFGEGALYAFGSGTHMAFPVSLALSLLFLAVLLSRYDAGWIASFAGRHAGGAMLRRTVPFAIIAPWTIGWMSLVCTRSGFCSSGIDQVLTVGPLIFISVLFLLQCAKALDKLDLQEQERGKEIEALNRELESRVFRRTEELMTANQSLRAAEHAAREQVALLHLAPVAILVRDLQSRITFWSRGAEELYGWSAEEALGKIIHQLLHTEFLEPLPAIEERVQSGQTWEGELRHTRRSGQQLMVGSRWALQRDAHGEPSGYLEINVDFTERKHAEQELHRLNRALKALSRCTQEVARATDESALLQQVCDLIVNLGGYPLAWVGYAEEDEAASVRPVAVAGLGAAYVRNARITWADSERGRGPTGTAIRSGAPCYIPQITLDPRFGPWRDAALRHGYASVLAIPLREAGRSFGALNIYAPEAHAFEGEEHSLMLELAATLAHGILALRAHRERDRAAVELQELNANLEHRVAQRTAELAASTEEMECFTYSVSHDLRAPLRHIDGFSKVLLEQCSGQLDDLARHYLERVRHGTQQMGQLVDDLLNLSRLGRCALQLRPTPLGPMVRELVDEFQSEAAGRLVEWHIGGLPRADCDPGLMRQVLFNLLANALKFTRGRNPAIIEVGTRGPEVFVRDNGVGFDPQYAGKLFGVFQRLHRPEEFPGTGVGLATVRRILRKHGGDIRAEAALNAGATFYFTLGRSAVASGRAAMEESHAA